MSECSSLVREEVRDATEFFRDTGVADSAAGDVLVSHDEEGVDEFGKVHVDLHRDGDDVAEEDVVEEEVEPPDALETRRGNEDEGKDDLEDAQEDSEQVDLLVEDSDLGRRLRRVHLRSRLPSRVQHQSSHLS